jgi:hypothetical protein
MAKMKQMKSPTSFPEICETFCASDLTTYLDNKKKILTTNKQIDALMNLDDDEIKLNIGTNSQTLDLDLAYFYSSPLVMSMVDQ